MQNSLTIYSQILLYHLDYLRNEATVLSPEQIKILEMIYEQTQILATKFQQWHHISPAEHGMYCHDVRNILTPLVGFTQLLVEGRFGQIDMKLALRAQMLDITVRALRAQFDQQTQKQPQPVC